LTTSWHRIRFLGSVATGSILKIPAAIVAGASLALWLGTSAGALATENETGDAEAAPAALVSEFGEPKLVVTAAAAEPGAVMSPARVFAHTALLPLQRPSRKPLFPVELPVLSSMSSGGPSGSAGTGASKPIPASRVQLAAAKAKTTGAVRRSRLPLLPSAAEIRREIAARNGGPESVAAGSAAGKDKLSAGARLEEKATTTPAQNPRWPTHVDYSAGPTGPAGGDTAGDRKGALIEATGPQQGVIRNRW
jgi:hypothetical protein